jgi:hypothetical protein
MLMQTDEPVVPLDYESRTAPHPARIAWGGIAVIGLGIALINALMTMCMCGYLNRSSIPGNAVAFAITGLAFLRCRGGSLPARIAIGIAFIFVSLLVFQNIHNVLWSGHNPLLR